MRVFITGATGVLGTRLVAELANRGHEPVGLVRDDDDDGARTVERRGGTPAHGDLFDAGSLADTAGDADAVVHAATSTPTKPKPSAEDWGENDRVRVEGAAALEAAARVDADRFLTHTVVRASRNRDGSAFDEDASPNTDRTTASVVDAERAVREAGRRRDAGSTRRSSGTAGSTARTPGRRATSHGACWPATSRWPGAG